MRVTIFNTEKEIILARAFHINNENLIKQEKKLISKAEEKEKISI